MLLHEIKWLLKKEMILEWRQRYALNGILLYVVSAVFICYLSFNLQQGQLNVVTWNALFWIIMLFVAFNAISKSFLQERYGRQIYYYTLTSPQAVILSKMLYNLLLMLLLAMICFVFYAIVLGNPVQNLWLFGGNLLLGAGGFSVTLTMISGIASKASNSSSLMAILGFPVMVPILLMVIRVSKNAIDGLAVSVSYDEVLVLLAVNVMVGTVAYILFPFLWRS